MMRLYDTKTRKLESILQSGDQLKIYACGPTVYRYAHVGNMRTFLLLDLITRLAKLNGMQTLVVQNITDVGHLLEDVDDDQDRVVQEAKLLNQDPFALARFFEKAFLEDLERLNIQRADHYPRASETIEEMIKICSILQKNGFAYVGKDGSLFFDAKKSIDYGAISGNKLAELQPGHRFGGESDSSKNFHADWALWKLAPNRSEMVWDSPWGVGFPGWHIECSAMSLQFLGDHVDLHLGGIDLRFPHHENERAQSNSVAGKEVVSRWVHGEHLLFDGKKMSKSTGNVLLVSDLTEKKVDPLALRLALMETRYRTQIDLSWDSLFAADRTLKRWRKLIQDVGFRDCEPELKQRGLDILNEDLNSPALIQMLRALEGPQQVAALLWFDQFLALDLNRKPEEIPPEVLQLLEQRNQARSNEDWKASDQLREEIKKLGYEVRDTPTGQELV